MEDNDKSKTHTWLLDQMNKCMERKRKDAKDATQDQEWAAYYNAPINTNTVGDDAAGAPGKKKRKHIKNRGQDTP